jgi:nucleoside-diphosphate-sugar epimerase
MHVLVTGGLGSIGKRLVERLVTAGHKVRLIDRRPERSPAVQSAGLDRLGVAYHACDILDFAALRSFLEGVDAVIHLAAIISPGRGQPQDVFQVNAAGTFNVYQAAVDAEVPKLVNTSSINFLGYNFGVKPVPLHYFPIDEDHPALASDPYSLSKQVCEQVGVYFWRRYGYSSFSLRPTGVYDPAEFTPQDAKDFVAGFHDVLHRLLGRPESERKAIVRQAMALFDETRPERAVPGAGDSWVARGQPLVERSPEAVATGFAFGGHSDFWTSIDVRDVCQAYEKALGSDLEGHHPLLITDSHNLTGIESERLLALFFPEVTRRTRPLVGTESIVSIDRARSLIGFEPEFSVKRFYPSAA